MIDKINKKLATIFLKPIVNRYLKKEHTAYVKGFNLLIKPTVFHPKFFFSSLYFFDFINTLSLNERKILEIGCGSGLLSLLAYKKGAEVTCSDINPLAVECTLNNFDLNFKKETPKFSCIHTDLFENFSPTKFDFIIINPPYFFENVRQQEELAWNCGKNGEFFIKLFSELTDYTNAQTKIYMILADNCEISRINEIAKKFHFTLHLIEKKKIKWELNYIFSITPIITA